MIIRLEVSKWGAEGGSHMKRILTLVVPLVLAMVFVTGCGGISKESYDAAVKEASVAKA